MPRFIVYGAGAIGGAIGSRLFEHGHDVVLIARGPHREAIARVGLRFECPDGVLVQPIEVVAHPAEIAWRDDDVVLLTVKGQDTVAALAALEAGAGPDVAVACAQNGVENERATLRRFAHTYSVVVQLPATHLEPGVVVAHSAPVTGALDIGRYPDGLDDRAQAIAAVFSDSGFAAQPRADISRWKYAKFLRNVPNAVDALFDRGEAPEVERRAVAEAVAALDAAGIAYVGDAEYDERHRRLITTRPVPGHARGGGSSWQSLARASGVIETDHLNGEVVLLGRLHGVPTPVNELLQRLAGADARAGVRPGGHGEVEFLAMLEQR
ncbi:MAG TPA: 2-dehydropantoate 2-reductase [Solirubrobacteraceae bacterium]|nr:2-dehydropantoate 2-reductase [Solirubrobacteraceae bacterium]